MKTTIEIKKKVVFEFETADDWEPGKDACWTDCPFSILLKLGESCPCVNKVRSVDRPVCPFTK